MANTELFNKYNEWGWALLPVATDEKTPIENNWTGTEHRDITEWNGWVDVGLNVGVRCGEVSNLTVIDLDHTTNIPEEIRNLCGMTLIAKTTNGFHLFYKFQKDLPTTRIISKKLDILGNGRQCVIPPSVVSKTPRSFQTWNEPISMPEPFVRWLLDKTTTKSETVIAPLKIEDWSTSILPVELGCRNTTLLRLGGILRKNLNIQQTSYALQVLNSQFLKEPLSLKELTAMVKSLERYLSFDEQEFASRVYKYMKLIEVATANDAVHHFGESRERIDKALSYLKKEGYIVFSNNKYHIVTSIDWKDYIYTSIGEQLRFNVPYFNDICNFYYGDLLIIGATTGSGKTHISMNILKQLIDQQLTPYLITTENIARTFKIAKELGIVDNSFKYSYVPDVKKVELPKNSVVILDWLQIEDYSEVGNIFKYISEMLQDTQSFLICFSQLKWDGSWFAPNMIHHYATLSAKYSIKNEERTLGRFSVDKNRDPLRDAWHSIDMSFDPITKLLHKLEVA